jgi:hypothetical protein
VLGPLVHRVGHEPYPLEPELPEAEVEDRVHRVRSQALAAPAVLADRHPEARRSVQPVDLEHVRPADRLVVLEAADDEREPVAPGLLDGGLGVHPAAGEAARPLAHEPGGVGVAVPAVDVCGVLGLEGAEVNVLAADQRVRAFRRVRHRRGWYAATRGL